MGRLRNVQYALVGVKRPIGCQADFNDPFTVGVNVQVEGYDLSRVMDRVVFRGNGVNLDSAELPVPDAMVATAGPGG